MTKDKFDNSDYSKNSTYYDESNKKVIGKFKDEPCGIEIKKGEKTAKGIKKNVIKNDIKHKDYRNTLFKGTQLRRKMKTIRSRKHQLGSYEINKVSLSCFDDKRYIHDKGIMSYAYGHYKIE